MTFSMSSDGLLSSDGSVVRDVVERAGVGFFCDEFPPKSGKLQFCSGSGARRLPEIGQWHVSSGVGLECTAVTLLFSSGFALLF